MTNSCRCTNRSVVQEQRSIDDECMIQHYTHSCKTPQRNLAVLRLLQSVVPVLSCVAPVPSCYVQRSTADLTEHRPAQRCCHHCCCCCCCPIVSSNALATFGCVWLCGCTCGAHCLHAAAAAASSLCRLPIACMPCTQQQHVRQSFQFVAAAATPRSPNTCKAFTPAAPVVLRSHTTAAAFPPPSPTTTSSCRAPNCKLL
jgi:hypothetical protein